MCLIGMTTYNHYSFTSLCLKYIERFTNLKENRFIVVDNGSTDGTVDRIKKDFPWVENVISNNVNSQPVAFNILFGELKENEDHIYIPNDIVVGPNWLEFLIEDAYKYDNIGITSPYIPFDLCYDNVINKDFSDRYMNEFYGSLSSDPTVEVLENTLNKIYFGDFEKFCLEFQNRNKNEGMLDEALTHVMYYKNWAIKKVGLYDEAHSPHGNEDRDYFIRMNNLDIYRSSSCRSFVHHWLSITQRQRFGDWSSHQDKVYKASILLLQKYSPILGSVTYNDKISIHSNILNHKTPYRKFKVNDPIIDFNIAKNTPGIRWMLFDGLKPGEDYWSTLSVGSVLRKDDVLYDIKEKNSNIAILEYNNIKRTITYSDFIRDKYAIAYYWRREENDKMAYF